MKYKKVLLNVFLMTTFLMGTEGKAQSSSSGDQPWNDQPEQRNQASNHRAYDPNMTDGELWEWLDNLWGEEQEDEMTQHNNPIQQQGGDGNEITQNNNVMCEEPVGSTQLPAHYHQNNQ